MENISQKLKTLQILFFAMILGQIFLFSTFFLLHYQGVRIFENSESLFIFNFIAPLGILIFTPLGYFLYSQKCKEARKWRSDGQKMSFYFSACLQKYVCFEMISVCAAFALLFSKKPSQSLIILGISLVLFFINKPSLFRFETDTKE